jgi:glycosyltransferase involved in cell wall biosynthesis
VADERQLFRRSDNVMRLPRQDGQRAKGERTPGSRLRIAMLAPPWIPVPPPGYGGIEEVLSLLCDALVDQGHDVELFCAPGSRSKATVRPLLDAPHPESIERAIFEADHTARAFDAVEAAAAGGGPFDVIHDHSGYTALGMANRIGPPLVHTVHGPFDNDTTSYYAAQGHKGAIVCLSRTQAGAAPDPAEIAGVVPNPIDFDSWPLGEEKEDFLLWVGRFVPEKGPHRAIEVARQANRPLVLAGVVQPRHERFFAEEVQPHIDGSRVRYIGEVGGVQKQRLFADAYAFLMPIRWPEPFGMVMVESLAAGTPVLAFPEGAAPEIVEDGVTGFLVDDEEAMARAVERAGELDPHRCRQGAERFAPHRVAGAYEEVYRQTLEEAVESSAA